MQNSSNSLLHFTNSLDTLIKILTDRFYASYCLEKFAYGTKSFTQIVPKISFCDIPEESIPQYSHYGKFCIGLTKKWAVTKRLNPVLYIEKDSIISEALVNGFDGTNDSVHLINKMVSDLSTIFHNLKSDVKLGEDEKSKGYKAIEEGLDIITRLSQVINYSSYSPYYVKHYQDDLHRKNNVQKDYRFYDEHEWCFIPDLNTIGTKHNLSLNQYKDWKAKNSGNNLLDDIFLEFDFSDITHLLVETEGEKSQLVSEIENWDDSKISKVEKGRLISLIQVFELYKANEPES